MIVSPTPDEANRASRRVPRGLHLPDLSHLSPEDAELFTALYIERNYVSRGELQRVRADRLQAVERAA